MTKDFIRHAVLILKSLLFQTASDDPPALKRVHYHIRNVGKSRQRPSLPSSKRLRAGRSPFFRAHVLPVHSARQHKGFTLQGEPGCSCSPGRRKQYRGLAGPGFAETASRRRADFFDHCWQTWTRLKTDLTESLLVVTMTTGG